MKAAVIYWSKSGNTEKVAVAIKEGLEASRAAVTYRRTEEAGDLDWFDYDLVCVGFPSYQFIPFTLVAEISDLVIHPFENSYAWGMTLVYGMFMTLLYFTIKKFSETISLSR